MDTLVMVAQIILSLSILVGLHEFGHLIAAKIFGMRVEQYSIGFPPKIFKFKWGETEYALSAIPLGGYVKISGMIDESLDTETMKEDPKPWEFRSKPAWQRLIVMLGGIIINVITGIVIYIIMTYTMGETYINKEWINENGGIHAYELGQKVGLQSGDKLVAINGEDFSDFQKVYDPATYLEDEAYFTVSRNGELIDIAIPGNFIENLTDEPVPFIGMRVPPVIDSVAPATIASRIGIQSGDTIANMQGVELEYFDQIGAILKNRGSDSLSLSILRNGEIRSLTAYVPRDSTTLGVTARNSQLLTQYLSTREFGLGESVVKGTHDAFAVVFLQIKAFGKMFSGDLDVRKSLSGPIGIAKAYGSDWEWPRFWKLTAILSMVLAFMNLLPIPALDGGHVMFLSAEIISGRKPSDRFLEIAQRIGMLILLALMVFIFANDILKLMGFYG